MVWSGRMRQDLLFSRTRALRWLWLHSASAVLFAGCSAALDFDSTSKGGAEIHLDIPPGSSFACDKVGPTPLFCADFETKSIEANWSMIDISPGDTNGSVDIDDKDAVAGEKSMFALLNAGTYTEKDAPEAAASKTFADFANKNVRLLISFDMKVDKFDPTEDARVTAFQFLFGCNENDYNQLVLSLASTGDDVSLVFRENSSKGGNTPTYDVHGDLGLRKWAHVNMEFDIRNAKGAGNSGLIDVDGEKIFDNELALPLQGGTPCAQFGEVWVDTTTPDVKEWQIRFDNVVVHLVPKS